jgi:hypothetical protein
MTYTDRLIEFIKEKHGYCQANRYQYRTEFFYGNLKQPFKRSVSNKVLIECEQANTIPLTIKNILK